MTFNILLQKVMTVNFQEEKDKMKVKKEKLNERILHIKLNASGSSLIHTAGC